jgi:hypothetical protein
MRFRERPREIEAVQYTGDNDDEIVGWYRRLCEEHPYNYYDKLIKIDRWNDTSLNAFFLENIDSQKSTALLPNSWLVFDGYKFTIFTNTEMKARWERIDDRQLG